MKRFVIIVCCIALVGCSSSAPKEEVSKKKERAVEEKTMKVSFLAVGDNLIHDSIYNSSKKSDGTYDFNAIYTNTNALTQGADIAYLNQETMCGGK